MHTPSNTKKQVSSLQTLVSQSTYAKSPFKTLLGGKLDNSNTVSKSKTGYTKQVLTLIPFHKSNSTSRIPAELPQAKILDPTASMTWFVDEDDCLSHANNAFLHFLKIEKKDLNKKLTDIVPGDIREKFIKAHLSVRVSGIPSKKIIMQPLADGTSSQYFITIYPFTNHDNKNFLVGEAFDITGDFPVQEKINKDDERLNLLKATSETFWEWDMKSGYVCGNENLNKLVGSGQNNAVSATKWYSLIHPKDRRRIKSNHKNATRENQSNWEHEFRMKTISRGYITLLEKGIIIYEKGETVRMIGSLRDITELKILESKLLQQKIKQQKKLIRARVTAQEKERIYLGNELHDNVNQLLVASKLFLEVIKTGDKKSEEIKDNVSQYLATASNEIRNLSHGLVMANFDQKGLVDSFKKILDDLALVGTFEIAFKHDEKIEALNNSKKITLLRILQEQTKNIIKHSRATKIDIGLTLANNKVQLYIRDNGAGFDLRTLRRGIGLSNIYDRIKLFNGTSELITSPGMGCELKVTMPFKRK